MTAQKRTLYLTTPIYYVNDIPHVGHAYTTIAADALTRARRLAGHDAFMLTGTDEHGQNIERIARERGISEQQHCDEIAAKFKELWARYDIRYDRFIRTTDEIHTRGVLKLWREAAGGEDAGRPGRRLQRHLRRLVLPALRGLQGRGRAAPARQHLPRPRAPVRVDRGAEPLLPALGLRELAPAADRERHASDPARSAEERGAGRDPAGAQGLERQPRAREVGDPDPRAARPRPLCMGGRALELHHGTRIRRRRPGLPPLLGGERRAAAPHRQGHHPLPLPLLAGDPVRGGRAGADPRVRAGLHHPRRPQALEDDGQRDRPGGARRAARARRRSLLPAARGGLRGRLGLHRRRLRRPLQRRSRERPRQPRLARAHDGGALLRRQAAAAARGRFDGCRAREVAPLSREPGSGGRQLAAQGLRGVPGQPPVRRGRERAPGRARSRTLRGARLRGRPLRDLGARVEPQPGHRADRAVDARQGPGQRRASSTRSSTACWKVSG